MGQPPYLRPFTAGDFIDNLEANFSIITFVVNLNVGFIIICSSLWPEGRVVTGNVCLQRKLPGRGKGQMSRGRNIK